MTKTEALQVIIKDDRLEKLTKTSYARVKRALKVLGFTGSDLSEALHMLDYEDAEGNPQV